MNVGYATDIEDDVVGVGVSRDTKEVAITFQDKVILLKPADAVRVARALVELAIAMDRSVVYGTDKEETRQ